MHVMNVLAQHWYGSPFLVVYKVDLNSDWFFALKGKLKTKGAM